MKPFLKNLQRLNCAAASHSSPCDEMRMHMAFGQPFYSPGGVDEDNMTHTKDYVIDDLVLAEWTSAGPSTRYEPPSAPKVEVSLDESNLDESGTMVDLAKEMRQSRIEDESRIKELRNEKEHSHDFFTPRTYASSTTTSTTRRETISTNPTRFPRRTENVFREYRSAREVHNTEQYHHHNHHQETKDAFSVDTGDTEQETLDGSWPDDNFSRSLHSSSGNKNSHIRQVHSLEQAPRRVMEQSNVPRRARSMPAREEDGEDETCDITSCRMSSGICVDCTKCARHCTCGGNEPSRPLFCDPNTCKQLICGDCSRCTRHCECNWTSHSTRDTRSPRHVSVRKHGNMPVYPQQRSGARRSPLPPSTGGAGRHRSSYAPSPPASPRSARYTPGLGGSPARSASTRHSNGSSSMSFQQVPRSERNVGIYGPKRKVVYRNIEQ